MFGLFKKKNPVADFVDKFEDAVKSHCEITVPFLQEQIDDIMSYIDDTDDKVFRHRRCIDTVLYIQSLQVVSAINKEGFWCEKLIATGHIDLHGRVIFDITGVTGCGAECSIPFEMPSLAAYTEDGSDAIDNILLENEDLVIAVAEYWTEDLSELVNERKENDS